MTDRSVNERMSPRSKQQNEAIRSRSRRKILDAAFELISRNGYESTSVSQIAHKANVSKGLIYNYFNSKEDVLQSLVISAFEEVDRTLEKMVQAGEKKDILRYMFIWFFEELRTRSELWKLITELSLKTEKYPFIHELLKQKYEEYIILMSDLLGEMNKDHPEYEARILAAILDGIGFHYLIGKDAYPLDEMESFLIDKYFNNKKADSNEK